MLTDSCRHNSAGKVLGVCSLWKHDRPSRRCLLAGMPRWSPTPPEARWPREAGIYSKERMGAGQKLAQMHKLPLHGVPQRPLDPRRPLLRPKRSLPRDPVGDNTHTARHAHLQSATAAGDGVAK